jgi:hypothetical protein
MSKIPLDKIKVGYAEYKLRPLSKTQVKDSQGMCDYTKHVIKYDRSQHGSEHVNTILHEIFHAICYASGLTPSNIITPEGEETFVNVYTNGITAVFKDNPKLLKWLFESLHPTTK